VDIIKLGSHNRMHGRLPLKPNMDCLSRYLCHLGFAILRQTFMCVMNDVFRPFLDEFVIVYLEDILFLVGLGMNM
jgi:hypothetical protein